MIEAAHVHIMLRHDSMPATPSPSCLPTCGSHHGVHLSIRADAGLQDGRAGEERVAGCPVPGVVGGGVIGAGVLLDRHGLSSQIALVAHGAPCAPARVAEINELPLMCGMLHDAERQTSPASCPS